MADQFPDFTIFRLSGTPSLNEITEAFRGFPELASPVAPAQAGPFTFYTVSAYGEKEPSCLPVFTDPRLAGSPYVAKPPLPFLQTLFSAPAAGAFIFNPPPKPGEGAPSAAVRLDKRQISAIIGYLQTPAPLPAGEDLETALQSEANLGNLHRANYMACALMAAEPSRPCGRYAEVLIGLGLLQEASDYVKDFQTPEFYYYRALIRRRTGETAKARQWLDRIPAGAPCENKKKTELAWLRLEEGRITEALDTFRTLAQNPSEKAAALFGAGCALMRQAAQGNDRVRINESLAAFTGALTTVSPLIPMIFSSMGDLHFRTGNLAEAETCYRKAAALWPSVRSKANLGFALIRTGKLQEAAALINDLALTDLDSAGRLAAELPRESAVRLLEASRVHREAPPPAPARPLPSQTTEEPVAISLEAASLKTNAQTAPPAPVSAVPLTPAEPSGQLPPALEMESLMETSNSAAARTEAETRKDDFLGRAFNLAAAMEDEFNKKIYFNADGLAEVEKKLRLTFIRARQDPQEAIETVKDCSAFFCFLLQERYKGRLIKLPDFDHWGWPMTFEAPRQLATYPIQRVWKLLWKETVPEPGWLTKYLQYLEEELGEAHTEKPQGAAAVQSKVPSHPERNIDAQTEHRRIILLTSTLEETSGIELGRSGIIKLEAVLKEKFTPDTPPTTDGWKLLRCCGHILAEILMRDLRAVWYNTEGNDGLWSMQLPWKTFVFPIGKVYKAASNRESLSAYYDALITEKLRIAGGG
ncbi:MAG: tetratricopeptide repeat protein [Elusimicrobiales bacterium]|jgi:tetratricopeptide (TPR) repeat protein